MPNVYVEPRPKGRRQGEPIDDYVVKDRADHVLGTFKHSTKRSVGREITATPLWLLACGT